MVKQRGKLIVIDGIDGAGKATQTQRLVARLIQEHVPVITFDFPQYDGFFGQLIGEYLRGEFGDPGTVSPKLIAMLYAADRWSAREKLDQALSSGAIVVTNRYVPSNINYQAAKVPPRQRKALKTWLKQLDYEAFAAPKEDATIFLHLSVSTSIRLVRGKSARTYLKGRKRDVHERNHSYMKLVATEYERYCKTEPTAHLIRCEQRGQLLTIDEIHEKIWTVLQPLLSERK